MSKRIVATVLCLVMVIGSVQTIVMADEVSEETTEITEEVQEEDTETVEETEPDGSVSEDVEAEPEAAEPEAAEPEETAVEVETEICEESVSEVDLMLASTTSSNENTTIYYYNGNDRIYPDASVLHNIKDLNGDYVMQPGHFYYAEGNVKITHRMIVKAWQDAVNLILCDGCTLNAEKGIGVIHVSDGNPDHESELRIWGQVNGTGKLVAKAEEDYAAIGGGYPDSDGDYVGSDGGSIVVHGGVIEAHAGDCAAGIGGSYKHSNRYFTMYGGKVSAYGGGDTWIVVPFDWADYCGAGIGGGDHGNGGNVTIYGGELYAEGFRVQYSGVHSAGIGGGDHGNGANVSIYGGKVEAYGKGSDVQAIGHGDDASNSGSLYLADDLSVYHKSWGNDKKFSFSNKNDRAGGCHDSHVIIERCSHEDCKFIDDNPEGHGMLCDHCLTRGYQGELHPHDFGTYGGTCLCGFEAAARGIDISSDVMGYSLNLGSDISVKYFIRINETIAADPDTYVNFVLPAVNGTPVTVTQKLSEDAGFDQKTGCYTFVVNVNSKDINSIIGMYLHYKGQTVCSDSFRVRNYAEYIYNHPADNNQKAVAAAMLNYGAEAQKYFNYNYHSEKDLANSVLDDNDKIVSGLTESELNGLKNTLKEFYTTKNIPHLAGVSLALKSTLKMKLYFYDDGRNHSFYDYETKEMLPQKKSDGYIIVTVDVRFGRMFSGRQILIDGVKNCSFVNVCPSRYIYKVLTGDYPDELKALVTSLYRYGSAIVAGNNTKAV